MVFCEDGVYLNEIQGYFKYYNSVRVLVVLGFNSLQFYQFVENESLVFSVGEKQYIKCYKYKGFKYISLDLQLIFVVCFSMIYIEYRYYIKQG